MNGNAAIDLLVSRLGNRLNQSDLRSTLLLEMQLAQEMTLERGTFKPWFMWTWDTTLVTVADTETVTMPTNFVGFPEEVGGVWIYNADAEGPDKWRPLARVPFAAMQARYRDDETDMPKVWDMIGTSLYLRPIPDDVYSLKMLYEASQTAPADSATANSWLTYASDWLIAETGLAVLATHLQGETDLVTYFETMRARARDRCWREHEAKLENLMNRSMGDD